MSERTAAVILIACLTLILLLGLCAPESPCEEKGGVLQNGRCVGRIP